jgi:cell division protein FtsL
MTSFWYDLSNGEKLFYVMVTVAILAALAWGWR